MNIFDKDTVTNPNSSQNYLPHSVEIEICLVNKKKKVLTVIWSNLNIKLHKWTSEGNVKAS